MNKAVKKLFSTVSVVLCASIGLSLPIEVYAKSNQPENQPEEQTCSSFDEIQGETEKIGNILTELTDERTEYAKEFLLDDGTKMIAEYDQPIHYKNGKGEWVDYNNDLASDSKAATSDDTADGELVNKSSNIQVKLSNKAKKNNMIKVISDDYSISWGYDGANKSKALIIKDNTKFSGNDKFTTLINLTSETLYEDVFKNVDLQYFVSSTGVKENIILKSSDVQNEFNVTYKIKNLTAKQADDYTISLYNKRNKEVYKIIAPYMMDAKGKTSTQLKLSLESQKGSNLNVKLTADYSFIHGFDRSFPITVDPEITTGTNSSLNEAYKSGYLMNHGPYYMGNNEYTTMKVNSLRSLDAGSKIISAKYHFNIRNHDTLFSNENDNNIIINAHKLTGYNDIASYDPDVIDYDSLSYSDNSSLTLDLTKLYNDWYTNGNSVNGFILEAWDTIGSKQVVIDDTSSARPLLTVVYKDYSGTEGNLSYHTFDAGQNAKASVSDYLGNLVIDQTMYEGTGSRMPVAITSTFNSFSKEWNYSFNQRITAADSDMVQHGYDYIYIDSQGTKHYLKKDTLGNKWYDEDGLGIELTVSGNEATVKSDFTQTYALPSNGGWLKNEKDEHNNIITYTRSNGKLTGIQDGAGRSITVKYSGNNISSFNLPGNKTVILNYSGGKITKVTFPDNRKSVYNYNNDCEITSIQQNDSISGSNRMNAKLGFNYTDGKVTKVTEYGSDNSKGNYLEIEYNNDNTTTFTDRQKREVTYTFDNKGNKISVLNANGFVESGENNGFSITGGADSFTKNYITESSEQTAIQNGGYYFKVNGSKGSTNSNGGTVSIDTSAATEENGKVQYLGTTSIKVNNPVSSSNSAFFTGAVHQFNDNSFNGKDVTFSVYVKTKDVQQIYSGGPIGATIKIKCFNSNNTALLDVNSIGINGTKEWQRLSISATIPGDTSYFRVYCNLRYASGTAWFDCLQLEDGNSANDFNALQNADFSNNDFWLTNDNNAITASNSSVTLEGNAGVFNDAESSYSSSVEETQPVTYYETVYETSPNDSVITYDSYGNQIRHDRGFVTRLVKKTYEAGATETTEAAETATVYPTNGGESGSETNPLGNKYIYQTVNVGRSGMMFNIVGEAKADSVPLTNENRTFGIAVNIYYDGENTPETHYQEFNSNTNKRQTVSLSVTPNYIEKLIDHIAFAFVYGYNKNTMTAYSAMLNIATVGYPVSEEETTEPSSEPATEEPTDEPFDDYVDYEVLSESVDTSQPYMSSEITYDASGNYQIVKKDEAGNETEYEYDVNGNITSVVNDNFYVDYTYDSAGNVTSISNDNIASTYTYNGAGDVSAIGHNGFSYTFNYDIYNQLISTAIGNVTIAGRTYSADGFLTKTDFANGDYIEYSYDGYGNLVQLKGENGIIAKFIYNKKGLVAKSEDISGGTVTYYQYDFSGSKTGEYRQAISGDLSYSLGYNSDGNKVEKTSINSQTKTITSGTDSDGNSFVDNDGVRVSSTSDDFGRTTEVITAYGGTDAFTTQYTYRNRPNSSATTNNVHSITQKHGDNTLLQYYYGFDSNGNIIGISETTNLNTSFETYQYDDLNQLEAAVDTKKETYTRIYYDNGGNITQVVKSNYDTFIHQPTTDIYRNTYTYGDSNWKDKLTKFNNQAITYDAMGNPLQYRDGLSFTWENGRRLKTVTNNGTTFTMLYDSNGLRTQKGGVRYYYDSDNNLIAMVKGENTLFFYYDENGSATSFSLGGNMYFYIKNLQGDIINIVDSSGTVLVCYDYDVFGKITAIKNGSNQVIADTSSLAFLNPLRYRGYVYDDETGLYYLQSRYYDPVTGRFLNADVYADTGSGSPLSSNRFCYCENNAINKFDKNGEDACWLQAEKAVKFLWKYMGHTSLLLQEKAGFWWYFYWGPDSIQMLFVPPGSLGSINTNIANQIKYWYNNRYTKTLNLKVYGGISEIEVHKYSKSLHMKGNFVSSVSKIKSMIMSKKGSFDERRLALFRHPSYYYYYKGVRYIRPYSMIFYNNSSSYSVLSRNCKHVSIDYLKYGSLSNSNKNKWFIWWLNVARAIPVPNDAYSYLVGKNIGTVVTV